MNRRFPVWAPAASEVRVLVRPAGPGADPGSEHRLERDPARSGWWALPEPLGLGEGEAEYGFLVDGRGPFADPRSLRQPQGVHEFSREFDPGGYAWADGDWPGRDVLGGVVYELHLGTFTPEGTLDAAIGRLDHLVRLGVDAVELLPVNAFNGAHGWGYDGVLWFAVHEPYGGPRGYQRFVDACHARGIAVVQDVVYNHLGPSGNHLPDFGPYLSQASGPWGEGVNLDGPQSDEVRRYILDNAEFWLREMHVDGLRLDAVHALHDARALHLLEELASRTDELAQELGRPLTLIAESDQNDPRLVRPRSDHGFGLSAQWDDDVHHAVHANITGESDGYYADFAGLGSLEKVYRDGWFHDGSWSSFRERSHGRPLSADTPFRRLVAFAQDHDQIGNRAAGERLSALVGEGSLAAAAALVLLGPFTPMLFMGEEWGASTPWQYFTSHPEPELAAAVAQGRVAEFARMGWDPEAVPDPQDPRTFERSRLDWSELAAPPHSSLLALYADLIALRRTIPADARATEIHADEDGGLFSFSRGPIRLETLLRPGRVEVAPRGGLLLAYDSSGRREPAPGSGPLLPIEGPGFAVVRLRDRA